MIHRVLPNNTVAFHASQGREDLSDSSDLKSPLRRKWVKYFPVHQEQKARTTSEISLRLAASFLICIHVNAQIVPQLLRREI